MSFEKYYCYFIHNFFRLINPIKKQLITTDCQVHIFNNHNAIRLLKTFGFLEAHSFYKKYMHYFNQGSVWADQNFKSSNHFYNPETKKGLFGRSHSMKLVKEYYAEALGYYISGRIETSMFFLGACTHIIQDLTIPQHVKVRLLDHHHQFENFVKYTFDLIKEYRSDSPPIILDEITTYVEYNARIAIKLDRAYGKIHPLKLRYYKITLSSLPLAQSTTAGAMLLFLEDIRKFKD